MHNNLAVMEWDFPVRHGVNSDRKITLQGSCLSLVQVQIIWVILGCHFNAVGVFHCHHENSEPAQPESLLMGVASKFKKEVLYISSLWPSPPSLCLLPGASVNFSLPVCLFFLCLYVGFDAVSTLPIFHSHVHKCFSMFSISLSLTLTQTNTQIFVFSHTLFLRLVAAMMHADVDWLFLQMINIRIFLLWCMSDVDWVASGFVINCSVVGPKLNPRITSMTFCTKTTNNLLISSFCRPTQTDKWLEFALVVPGHL